MYQYNQCKICAYTNLHYFILKIITQQIRLMDSKIYFTSLPLVDIHCDSLQRKETIPETVMEIYFYHCIWECIYCEIWRVSGNHPTSGYCLDSLNVLYSVKIIQGKLKWIMKTLGKTTKTKKTTTNKQQQTNKTGKNKYQSSRLILTWKGRM